MRGKALDERLAFNINKVFLGVMGSLRDMCLLDRRPPRQLYVETACREPTGLAAMFFVHSLTGDVLSLLPFVSVPRVYSSCNIAKDEDSFRMACARLALYTLYAHVEIDEKLQELMNWWETEGSSSNAKHPALGEPRVGSATVKRHGWRDRSSTIVNACTFCRTGLVNDNTWSTLGPKEAGKRDLTTVDLPCVWLGETSRTPEAVKARLIDLGFREPLRVSVIEWLREKEASVIREEHHGFTTKPETCHGLKAALTFTPCSNSVSRNVSIDNTYTRDSASGCVQTRSNDTVVSYVPQQFDTTESSLVHTRKLSEEQDATLIASSGSSTDLATCVDEMSDRDNSRFVETLNDPRESSAIDPYLTAYASALFVNLDREEESTPVNAVGVLPVHHEHEANSEGVNASWELSDVDASNSNMEVLTDSHANESYEPDVGEMLKDVYFNWYADEPQTLAKMITGTVTTNILSVQRFDQPQPAQDMAHTGLQQQQTKDHGILDPYLAQPVEAINCVLATEDRVMNPEETAFMKSNTRWKSKGFNIDKLQAIGYTPYQGMAYITGKSINPLRCTETTVEQNLEEMKPIANPCAGLSKDFNRWVRSNSTAPAVGVVREDPQDRRMNWTMGVESSRPPHRALLVGRTTVSNKRIASSALSCRTEPQMYHAVNLAEPPDNGFKHVELSISEFPVVMTNSHALLTVKSTEMFYLGRVCTIPNVSGLLVHRIFGEGNLLESILDKHTSLQVHPFVPRTFSLQISKTPFLHMPAVGMFVGEAAGEWNLGHAYGMDMISETDYVTLAYHVMQCLLRAQITSFRILGFTMKCIQPARIWRWCTGFRVDFIGCLTDTLYDLTCPVWGEREGLAAIRVTMQKLELLDYVPTEVRSTLQRADVPGEGGSIPSLYNVYNLCKFTEQDTSVESDLETILGSGQYKQFRLNVVGPTQVEPFGPFILQVHHQIFRWNKAIIVEPVLRIPAPLAYWLPAMDRTYKKKKKKQQQQQKQQQQ